MRPWWAIGVLSLWFGACLNPMPEEFPFDGKNDDGDGAPVVGEPDSPAEGPEFQGGGGTGSLGSQPGAEPPGENAGTGGSSPGSAGACEPDAGAAPADAGCEVDDGGL